MFGNNLYRYAGINGSIAIILLSCLIKINDVTSSISLRLLLFRLVQCVSCEATIFMGVSRLSKTFYKVDFLFDKGLIVKLTRRPCLITLLPYIFNAAQAVSSLSSVCNTGVNGERSTLTR